MPYYVVFETMHSDGEEGDIIYVADAEDEEDAFKWWKIYRKTDEDKVETVAGNVFTYDGCQKMKVAEFRALSKFCHRII